MPKRPPPTPPSSALVQVLSGPSELVPAAPLPAADVEALQMAWGASRAANTLRAYETDWRDWASWCAERSQQELPADPNVLAAYVASRAAAGHKPSTVARRLSTIARRHKLKGLADPTTHEAVSLALAGVRRIRGVKPKQKAPLTREELGKLQRVIPLQTLRGKRDWALLLMGFAGAFRSAELVRLTVADLDWRNEGVIVHVRRSKTDQEGQGHLKPLAYNREDAMLCAPSVLRTWLDCANVKDGLVFRSFDRYGHMQPVAAEEAEPFTPNLIAVIVKKYAQLAGLDAARVASHSLRAGHVTQAYEDGVDEAAVAQMTGHKSVSVLRRYDRRRDRNPFAGVTSNITQKKSPKKEQQ